MIIEELGNKIKNEIKKVVFGQDQVIDELLTGLLAGGHVLIEGVPGLAKTLIAKTLSFTINGEFKRIQFTPDLMPSDIIGVNIFNMQSSDFVFKKGPVFTNILLADEINRTPPKTQSALLQAMEERFLTVDGINYILPEPFFVLATQNPIEYEGTYPLPETQLDRFLLKILIDYPGLIEEESILKMHNKSVSVYNLKEMGVTQITDINEINQAKKSLSKITVEDPLFNYIIKIIEATRKAPQVVLGGSPRSAIALLNSSKVIAGLSGRDYLIPDDIKRITKSVLRHRIILKPEAELENVSTDTLIDTITNQIAVPK